MPVNANGNNNLFGDKVFEGTLVINWKAGKFKVYSAKHKVKIKSGFEIPVHFIIKVKVPKPKELIAKGEIEISQTKVNEMIIEAVAGGEEDGS